MVMMPANHLSNLTIPVTQRGELKHSISLKVL